MIGGDPTTTENGVCDDPGSIPADALTCLRSLSTCNYWLIAWHFM